MSEEFLEEFFIEELKEREPVIANSKIYFDHERDEVYVEGLEWFDSL